MPSFPTQLPNFLVTPSKAPTIMVITCFSQQRFHILVISLFRSWYFSTFSPSFSLKSSGIVININFNININIINIIVIITIIVELLNEQEFATSSEK